MKDERAPFRKFRDEYDQPLPIPESENPHPPVQPMVIKDIESRMEIGKQRYGQYLRPFNGRDSLKDCYEEAIDLCIYLRQMLYERDGK